MFYAPLNGITWSIGAIATTRFGLRSLKSHKENLNPIAKIYGYVGITLGIAFFFYGIPALLTNNTSALKYTMLSADVFVQLSMQILVWLMWFLGLRNYMKLRYLLTISGVYSLILLVYEAFTGHVTITSSPHYIVNYIDKPLVLIMQGVIYISLALPLGYYFLLQVPKQTNLNAKLKNFMNAMIFFFVSIAATSNNIFDKGGDTESSALVLGIFFIVFLIVSFIPRNSFLREEKQLKSAK
jgi:hypothetical protein